MSPSPSVSPVWAHDVKSCTRISLLRHPNDLSLLPDAPPHRTRSHANPLGTTGSKAKDEEEAIEHMHWLEGDKASLGKDGGGSWNPTFMYPIFEEEVLYGYKEPKINLQFTSASLSLLFQFTNTAKLESAGSSAAEADDVEEILKEFLPEDYITSPSEFSALLSKDHESFSPPGEFIGSYRSVPRAKALRKKRKRTATSEKEEEIQEGERWVLDPIVTTEDENSNTMNFDHQKEEPESNSDSDSDPDQVSYVAHLCHYDTPGFLEIHKRIQVFVVMEIEGGSYIDIENKGDEDEDEEKEQGDKEGDEGEGDERWEVILLYERRKRKPSNNPAEKPENAYSYHFVGFTTLYRFYKWPDSNRMRLSQFIILPPFQKRGHGSTFYNLVMRHILGRDDISELTVEDPSQSFGDMRDRQDLKTLVRGGAFDSLFSLLAEHHLAGNGLVVPGQGGMNGGIDVKGKGKEKEKAIEEDGEEEEEAEELKGMPKKEWIEQTRKNWKLSQRQFSRVLEMALLLLLTSTTQLPLINPSSASPPSLHPALLPTSYRLYLKSRLFRHNYELLSQLDSDEEMKERLEECFEDCVRDYERLAVGTGNGNGGGAAGCKREMERRQRKLIGAKDGDYAVGGEVMKSNGKRKADVDTDVDDGGTELKGVKKQKIT